MKKALMPVSDKLLFRKRAIIDTFTNSIYKTSEHSRHRTFDNFIINILSAIAAYCCFPQEPYIKIKRTIDTLRTLF